MKNIDTLFEEFVYTYKPRPFHFFLPVGIVFIGWSIIHLLGHDWNNWVLAILLDLVALLISVWMVITGILQSWADLEFELTDEQKKEAVRERYWNNMQITEVDERWTNWAVSVLAGRPISQRTWTGDGKPFEQKEYSQKINDLLRKKVLKYSNGKNSENGFDINGEGGRAYIMAMSEGRRNLPLPSPTE